jgi:predicted transcriptional regulator
MRTVTLDVCPEAEVKKRFARAFEGVEQGEIISFESPALLFKLLTRKRWELLSVMTGAGPMSVREAARRAGRDVKAVHGDIHALLDAGVLAKTDEDLVVFPYDAVHVDFTLRAVS